MSRSFFEAHSTLEEGVPSTLEEAYEEALASAQSFYDATSVEEANWTGWGDCSVPAAATMRRVKAQQALFALRDADPQRAKELVS